VLVGLLIVLGSLMVIIGVLAIWLNTVIFDSSTWRATSEQIIRDPAVQHQTSVYVVDQLYDSGAVENEVAGSLPPKIAPFAPAVTSALKNVAIEVGDRLLATEPVQKLFVEASVKAHDQFALLITDQTKFAKIDGDKIILDLRPVLIEIADKAGAGAQAERRLPADAGKVEVMTADQLSTLQTAVRVLHALSVWAAFICVVVFALAIWLADGFRRRALLWSAIGILIATFVMVFVRRALGSMITDALVGNVSVRPAYLNAWYIGTDVIGTINLTLLIIALVMTVGLWLAGDGRWSAATRRRLAPWIAQARFAFGIPALVLLVLLVWMPLPIFEKLFPVLAIVILGGIGIEALRRQVIAERAAADPAGTTKPHPPA
jgi:hypothetical protein